MSEVVVREYEEITGLDEKENTALRGLALDEQKDASGNYRRVLSVRSERIYAANYVGIVEVSRKTTLVILPKVELGGEEDAGDKGTKKAFFEMLRDWRGLREPVS